MSKKIEVTIHHGKIIVEAHGFDPSEYINGLPACEVVTAPLEDLLGKVKFRERKEELAARQCGLAKNFCG